MRHLLTVAALGACSLFGEIPFGAEVAKNGVSITPMLVMENPVPKIIDFKTATAVKSVVVSVRVTERREQVAAVQVSLNLKLADGTSVLRTESVRQTEKNDPLFGVAIFNVPDAVEVSSASVRVTYETFTDF